jgi:hypothetical protein
MVPALKKNGPQAIGKSRGGWTTKIHLVAASDGCAISFRLSPGRDHDAPAGFQFLIDFGPVAEPTPLIMDRAYEGDDIRLWALNLGYVPVVPPKSNRVDASD